MDTRMKKTNPIYKSIVYLYVSSKNILFELFFDVTQLIERVSRKYNLLKLIFKKWIKTLNNSGFDFVGIKSHLEYATEAKSIYKVLNKDRKGISVGQVFSTIEEPRIINNTLPDICLYLHNDVLIHSQNDEILDMNHHTIINDFDKVIERDSNFKNNTGVVIIQKGSKALVNIPKKTPTKITSGIMVVNNFSNNYYHAIYEFLIRFEIINELKTIPKEIPLLVDQIIRDIPQLYEIFKIANTAGRNVIWIEKDQFYHIEQLYYISQINIVPSVAKNIYSVGLSDFGYDYEMILSFTNKLLLNQDKSGSYPHKVFLSRKGHARAYNEKEILPIIKSHGFTIVQTEKYSFAQQMKMFNNEEIIVGPTGAAITNTIFCKLSAKIVCFTVGDENLPIFPTGAYIRGVRMVYLKGIQHGKYSQYAYTIDPIALNDMLIEVSKL